MYVSKPDSWAFFFTQLPQFSKHVDGLTQSQRVSKTKSKTKEYIYM